MHPSLLDHFHAPASRAEQRRADAMMLVRCG
jgi:hypothetical protein